MRYWLWLVCLAPLVLQAADAPVAPIASVAPNTDKDKPILFTTNDVLDKVPEFFPRVAPPKPGEPQVYSPMGLSIISVLPVSAAGQAGVKTGDLLLSINGYRIFDTADFKFVLSYLLAGLDQQEEWRVLRGDEVVVCTLKDWNITGEFGSEMIDQTQKIALEIVAKAGLTFDARQQKLLSGLPGRAADALWRYQHSAAWKRPSRWSGRTMFCASPKAMFPTTVKNTSGSKPLPKRIPPTPNPCAETSDAG